MKILFLISQEPDSTLQTIIKENEKEHTVNVINLDQNNNYDEIIDAIEQAEKVISW